MFTVSVVNGGMKFWLRGTVFTFSIDRADKFEDMKQAMAAAIKAEKFMAPKIKRTYKIEEN